MPLAKYEYHPKENAFRGMPTPHPVGERQTSTGVTFFALRCSVIWVTDCPAGQYDPIPMAHLGNQLCIAPS
jgi:hypothetical protein